MKSGNNSANNTLIPRIDNCTNDVLVGGALCFHVSLLNYYFDFSVDACIVCVRCIYNLNISHVTNSYNLLFIQFRTLSTYSVLVHILIRNCINLNIIFVVIENDFSVTYCLPEDSCERLRHSFTGYRNVPDSLSDSLMVWHGYIEDILYLLANWNRWNRVQEPNS